LFFNTHNSIFYETKSASGNAGKKKSGRIRIRRLTRIQNSFNYQTKPIKRSESFLLLISNFVLALTGLDLNVYQFVNQIYGININ